MGTPATHDDYRPDFRNQGGLTSVAVKANTTVYNGRMLAIDASTGLAEPASDAAGKYFGGIAAQPLAANGGTDTPAIDRWMDGQPVVDCATTATQAAVGDVAYVYDDHTVALSGTSHSLVAGVITGIHAAGSRVRIDITAATRNTTATS